MLLPAVLLQGLASALRPSRSPQAAAQAWGAAYAAYARAAQAAGVPWVPTGAEEARFSATLVRSMTVGGSPSLLAGAVCDAILAFWMLPPVVFGPGAVTAFGGQAVLQSSLAALFSNPRNEGTIVATHAAAAMDAASRTVIVTLPIVGPSPLV